MRAEDAELGGELSGHYYFKDFYFSDSSLFAMIKILQIISALRWRKGTRMRIAIISMGLRSVIRTGGSILGLLIPKITCGWCLRPKTKTFFIVKKTKF
jgi:hypothetical protein